jgi:multicomponent K+:H+ antiporter subunit F
MIQAVLPYAAAIFAVALALSFLRLARGPAPADRILALDTLYVNALALLVLLGMILDTFAYFEVALVVALLGFVGTVAVSKFAARGDISE